VSTSREFHTGVKFAINDCLCLCCYMMALVTASQKRANMSQHNVPTSLRHGAIFNYDLCVLL